METGTGRIVTMVENRAFNNTDQPSPGTTAVNYNTDQAYGGSQGFQTGSTFKAFDLAAWLESGHSLYDGIDATPARLPDLRLHQHLCRHQRTRLAGHQ